MSEYAHSGNIATGVQLRCNEKIIVRNKNTENVLMIMFDIDKIMNNPELNTLTWEIIEARGIAAGDVVALYKTCVAMAETAERCHYMAMEWITPIDDDIIPTDVEMDVASTYAMMSKYLVRDAREIAKFLVLRGFEFPAGTTGTRPDGSEGAE
jgi:hypothetical protein